MSHRAKLVIEADGGQHHAAMDQGRTTTIGTEGYRVLRFWNNDIFDNPEGVLTIIADALFDRSLHPTLPIKGREKKDRYRWPA